MNAKLRVDMTLTMDWSQADKVAMFLADALEGIEDSNPVNRAALDLLNTIQQTQGYLSHFKAYELPLKKGN